MAALVRQQLRTAADPSPVRVAVARPDTLHRAGRTLQKVILRREGEPPLPALLVLPTGSARPASALIWLPEAGKASVLDSAAQVHAYLRQGAAVLLADLRGLGETTDPTAFIDPKYYNREYRNALLSLHEGRPLLTQRVTDIFALLTFVRNEDDWRGVPVETHASGRAVAPALHASVLSSSLLRLTAEQLPPSYQQLLAQPTAKDVYSDLLPGVLQHYDLPDLQRALGSRLVVPSSNLKR